MSFIKILKQQYLFILIIILAFVLRFYQLGQVPVSPNWDEVSLGYNAYSVLLTGKDEFGKFLPVVIQSFGDYKPALYMYLAIPSIAIFGLNVFATRLPSVIFGVLGVIATYYLAEELFKKKSISLLSALFLSISPWALQFSRVAVESSVGDAFNIFVILFFLKGLKNYRYLFLSVACAALNLYMYQSEKAFTPLLVLVLVVIYHSQLFVVVKKTLMGVLLVGILLSLPMVMFIMNNNDALTRLASVNVFYDSFHTLQVNANEQLQDHQNHDLIGELLDNRRFVFSNKILANYASHFDPNWWFVKSDFTDTYEAPQMGHLYLWDLPFLLIGLYYLFFAKFDKKSKYFLIAWFLIVPIPAAITIQVPHAVRTLNFLPIFQILVAIGCVYSYLWLKDHVSYPKLKLTVFLIIFLLICNIIFYFDHYFVQLNYFTSSDWQYGYSQLMPFIQQHENQYQKIVVSNQIPLDQSYIFFLFYLKYPPQLYQMISEKIGHYTTDHAYGKFEFRKVNSAELENPVKGDLYIIGYYEYIGPADVIKTINFLNGKKAIKVIKG